MSNESEMIVDPSDQAETSKNGAKRMRRLLTPPKIGKPSTSAIHPITSHLIYPSTSPAFTGHLLTPLFSPRAPRPLPTPPVLTPGRELSVSPSGEWVVIFHPNPRIPNQASEGGTLAIYPSSILSPISKPTTRTTVPLATFQLPSDVLAIHHLYPPRLHLPPDLQARARGPAPPAGYESSQGPGLIVLTPTSLILLHPQSAGTPGGPPQYMMGMLTCPLHTRWHAAPGGSMPPETGWRVDDGWIGAVGNDEGVWVGWGRKGDVGVIRADLGMKEGRPYLRTTPMPPLPPLPASEDSSDHGEAGSRRNFQGMAFFAAPPDIVSGSDIEDDGIATGETQPKVPKRKIVGASLVYSEISQESTNRTVIEVAGFEHREVELVEGVSEMGGAGETEAGARSWDWFTLPSILRISTSPANSAILSLISLPDLQASSLSLAVVQSNVGLNLIHLDLCPKSESGWQQIGEGVPLDPSLSGQAFELVPSQAVQRGLRGMVGVISKEEGATLVLMPSVLSESAKGKGTASDLEDAAMGVVIAIRQGVSYADVVRVAFAMTIKDSQKDVAIGIIRAVHGIMQDDLTIADGPELHRLQVALFSHIRDDRRAIAAELVKLYEASHLFNTTAYASNDSIAFDLDTVWSLLSVGEWVMAVLSTLFRSVVLYMGGAAWSTPPTTQSDTSDYTRLLYVLHPDIRGLLVRLLAQVSAFKVFLETLEEPIMQPASRYMPVGLRRDPRATILARERARDLGVRDGVAVELWGRALEGIQDSPEASSAYKTAYLSLDPCALFALPHTQVILNSLPSPSSLLLSETDSREQYDGITFESIESGPGAGVMIRCDRCTWATKSLGFDLDLGGGNSVPGVGGERVGDGWRGYVEWRKQREEGCGCGGTWVRESVGAAAGGRSA